MLHTRVSDLNLARATPPTPRELNRLNHRFWKKQSRLAPTLAADANSFQEAMKNCEPELSTPAAVKCRDLELTIPGQQNRQVVSKATAKRLTPEQYVATHDVTKQLKRFGVTDEQFLGMRFRGSNKGWPFALWSYTWLGKISGQAIHLVKAYCALKWIVIEKPSYSRDQEDALRLVTETMAAPTVAIGERARQAQSKRAKKPRGKINEKETIGQLIASLVGNQKYRWYNARELWPLLWALLDGKRLAPKETKDSNDPENPKRWAYLYALKDGRKRKRIGFLRFRDIVSKVRGKQKSR